MVLHISEFQLKYLSVSVGIIAISRHHHSRHKAYNLRIPNWLVQLFIRFGAFLSEHYLALRLNLISWLRPTLESLSLEAANSPCVHLYSPGYNSTQIWRYMTALRDNVLQRVSTQCRWGWSHAQVGENTSHQFWGDCTCRGCSFDFKLASVVCNTA